MYGKFPLFQSHLDLAHHYWAQIVRAGDCVIDATCGNGHDSLFLAQLDLGCLWVLDLQEDAIQQTRARLEKELPLDVLGKVQFICGCHSQFPKEIQPESIRLITYNLGYLPGGDKRVTTVAKTTLKSVEAAATLVQAGGAISITCYPGHEEGKEEEQELLSMLSDWSAKDWSICKHQWCNRRNAPSLILIQKRIKCLDPF